jgi:glycosyltransferase involved in cell wall biosynthesis
LKVLHIYKNYFPTLGGTENYVRLLAEDQARNGMDVTVIVASQSAKTSQEQLGEVRVIRTGSIATVARTPLSISMCKWVRKLEVDITHLHFPYPAGEMAYLAFGRSRKMVITYHADIVKQVFLLRVYTPVLRRLLRTADGIIATSPNYIATSPFLSAVKDKCTVVPLGIDVAKFQRADPDVVRHIREKYRRPILLFVGRLRYFKGLRYLISAMLEIDSTLLVIGTGPEERSLKRQTVDLGLQRKVIFLGDVCDDVLPSYYHGCDLFVLPSSHRTEAFGTVLLEAMAAGRPVISTELGTGTSYANVHGVTGLVVPPRDSSALAYSIRALLEDDDRMVRFGVHALERASLFPKELLTEAVRSLYDAILNDSDDMGRLGQDIQNKRRCDD